VRAGRYPLPFTYQHNAFHRGGIHSLALNSIYFFQRRWKIPTFFYRQVVGNSWVLAALRNALLSDSINAQQPTGNTV
jgi:hypothetical protein